MKIFNKIFLLLLVVLTSVGCKKDKIEPRVVITNGSASIKGMAQYDINEDGIGDEPMIKAIVYYGDSILIADNYGKIPDSSAIWKDILTTFTDIQGKYEFLGLPPENEERKVLMIYPQKQVHSLQGTDITLDGDKFEAKHLDRIFVDVEESEIDDGNNFIAGSYKTSIKGSVWVDNDGDGIGDVLIQDNLAQLRPLFLLHRNVDGSPDSSHAVGYFNVINGRFNLDGITPGSYVIVFQEQLNLRIIRGEDETPDPDGIGYQNHPNWIPVDLTPNEIDGENKFTVQLNKGRILGSVLIDLNGDGLGDKGLANGSVKLYSRNQLGEPENVVKKATIGPDGDYLFQFILPGKYVLVLDNKNYKNISGEDISPDPDGVGDINHPNWILVDLEEDEQDQDNNFIVKEKGISGYVLEDIDNDSIGDIGIADMRMELYLRNKDGVPIGPIKSVSYTDQKGYFSFGVSDKGEYVIDKIGKPTPIKHCLVNEDLSPEIGEPKSDDNCIFISVNLLTDDALDKDNTYVLSR